jgi:hypothetical protein
MIKMGFKSVFRLVVFICWLALKPVRWILKKIFRRGDDDMFGRGKKKEQNNPYMNPNPYAVPGERIRFGAPPAIPAHMADQGYPPPYSQPQPYPQQPYPPAQPQVYPQPAPAPPAQQEQSYEQQRMVQNPFIELDKSFEQIQDAFSNVHARILDMEKDLDELFKRTNQIMGVQGRPERTVRFRN